MTARFKKLTGEEIAKKVAAGEPIRFHTDTLPHEVEVHIDEVLTAMLTAAGYEKIADKAAYCLNELMTNAKKANTKRVYFQEKGLNIHNPDDYERGMAAFKQESLENIAHYLLLQKEAGLRLNVSLQISDGTLIMEVRNNVPLLFEEYKRIHDKLMRGMSYANIQQSLPEIIDNSEGAGLGLIILVIMLKEFGVGANGFRVRNEGRETAVTLTIPLVDSLFDEQLSQIAKELLQYVDSLPQFSENINRVKQKLIDPKTSIDEIAMEIRKDISLSADVLKLVNSAAFGFPTKLQNINDAVKVVGLRGINNLLLSVGATQTLGAKNSEQKSIWKHSERVAFYMQCLTKKYAKKLNFSEEDSYICGLLHDMGKIAFSALHPEILGKIRKICDEKNIQFRVVENIVAGIRHDEIGALIAEKWNFPEQIIKAIRFHHSFGLIPDDAKSIAFLVAFADSIVHYADGRKAFETFHPDILSYFDIKNEGQLRALTDSLVSDYEKEQTKHSVF